VINHILCGFTASHDEVMSRMKDIALAKKISVLMEGSATFKRSAYGMGTFHMIFHGISANDMQQSKYYACCCPTVIANSTFGSEKQSQEKR